MKVVLRESEILKLTIPADIKKIHKEFKKAGKKLYIVGGAVRDAILDKKPKDFDLATDAKPDEVLKIAKKAGLKTVEVGKAFGVVIVNGNEIATFRKDIGKGRRPDAVDYTDIEGDVKRRDLTVNALFYDIDRAQIVDLVGGIEDLKNKKIKTVGIAKDRFDEDPLRKLRALRFQARLGGKLDIELLAALKEDPSLTGVSSERIKDEFIKSIVSAKSTKKYMKLLDLIGLTKLILPNIKIHEPYIDNNDPIVFLSYILQNNDVSSLTKKLNKLTYTNEEVKNISFLISLQKFSPENIAAYKKFQGLTTLSNNQILEFGKLIGKDLKKFVNFKLSVGGKDAPSHLTDADIGKWIKDMETKAYLNENDMKLTTILKEMQAKDYKIYCDLDGVLTDFEYQLKHFFNIDSGHDYEKKYGADKFWSNIESKGEKYWSDMPWMSDGKKMWDYIKDKNTEILSAPAKTIPLSRTGKVKWVKKNLGNPKLNLRRASQKKEFAKPSHILIDDYEKNIKSWIAAGGIGILHTSASNTIKQLKKLGI